MGKVDDLRALREARYNEARARLGTPTRTVPAKAAHAASQPPRTALPETLPEGPDPSLALCGHRAISGKTCIRPLNHTEKNHRYGKQEARHG